MDRGGRVLGDTLSCLERIGRFLGDTLLSGESWESPGDTIFSLERAGKVLGDHSPAWIEIKKSWESSGGHTLLSGESWKTPGGHTLQF
jgi:hypothetical protein